MNLQTERQNILIVDDSLDTLELFEIRLKDQYDVSTASNLSQARQLLQERRLHPAIVDLILEGEDGLDLIRDIKRDYPYMSVIAISGQASIETAVQAMKLGADEFIVKPIRNLDLINLQVERSMQTQWLIEENQRLNELIQKDIQTDMIIGNSASIQNVLQKVQKISKLDATVLITGETGVGKGVFAELIHRNSLRKRRNFVSVNCGSLTESLLESILYGHKRGAFTDAVRDKIGYFQEADGGTLFLDEITETSLSFQVKRLKVLETGTFRMVGSDSDISTNVRILAASNKDMKEAVKNGTFREDLYYRLNVINLHISPLRERKDDIRILANAFVKEFCTKYKKQELLISPATMQIILSHSWMGNIRELRNAIEHAVILAEHSIVQPEDLPESIMEKFAAKPSALPVIDLIEWKDAKQEFERQYLVSLLHRSGGSLTRAAKLSGIARENLYKKCEKYKLNYKLYRNTDIKETEEA